EPGDLRPRERVEPGATRERDPPPPLRFGEGCGQPASQETQLFPGAGERRVRRQPAEQAQPDGAPVVEHPSELFHYYGLGREGHEDVELVADDGALEPPGGHADDREWRVVYPDRRPDDVATSAEGALPQVGAEHGDGDRGSRAVVIRLKEASIRGSSPEDRKVVPRC